MPQETPLPFGLLGNVHVDGGTIVVQIQIADLKRILGIQDSPEQLQLPIPETNPDDGSLTIEEFNTGICAVYELNNLGRAPSAQEVTDLAGIATTQGIWISGLGAEKPTDYTQAERNEAFFLSLFGLFFARLGGFTPDVQDILVFEQAIGKNGQNNA